MMLQSVAESLLPVLLMIVLGACLRQCRFLPEVCFQGLNKLAFWVGLPCMLFLEISGARVEGGAALRIAATLLLVSLAAGVLGWGVALALKLPTPSLRVFVQGAFRGNLAYVGIPVVYYALSASPDARAVAVLALAPTIPVFNVACVLLLLQPGQGSRLRRAARALAEIARNPLILACVLGMLALWQGWMLPPPLRRTVEGVGRLGLPAALLALGASLSLRHVQGKKLPVFFSALIKVAVAPVIGYTIGRALGLTGVNLLITMLYAATPTAVASYVMADQMGADRELAAAIIVVSTLLAFPALALVLLLTH
ncbi:MAG: AEC family transporter [Lentisphaerae bacterium]|nr:AEC family transporter [Lentisphaerota bacterium]